MKQELLPYRMRIKISEQVDPAGCRSEVLCETAGTLAVLMGAEEGR